PITMQKVMAEQFIPAAPHPRILLIFLLMIIMTKTMV
ncbi:adhesin, partial [Escherichia coli]